MGLLWLFSLWMTISIAIKSTPDVVNHVFWSLPREFDFLQHIATAWSNASLGQGFTNSLIYAVIGASLAVLIGALDGLTLTAKKR